MADAEKREKVIKALECCTKKTCIYKDTEKECPYWELCGEYENSFEDCTTALSKDAIALLKAQEPRVLTLNEIPEHDGAVFIEHDPEDMSDEWMLFYAEHKPYLEFVNAREGRVYLATGTYNNIWRAWTSRPSAAQIKAEPWKEATP